MKFSFIGHLLNMNVAYSGTYFKGCYDLSLKFIMFLSWPMSCNAPMPQGVARLLLY